MNPLQAQFQSGIQSQAPTAESTNLQRQQLNTGKIGERMDGPSPQMLAVDPNLYADRKQARDFQALNQERARQQDVLLSDRQNQQALAREKLRYENQLAIGKAATDAQRQTILDAETREVEARKVKQKEVLEQARLMQILRNEQYADLRKPAGTIIQKYNAWNSGDGKKYVADTYRSLLEARANIFTSDQVKERWAADPQTKSNLGGHQPAEAAGPARGTKEYMHYQMKLLEESPEFADIVKDAERVSQQRGLAMGQQLSAAYTAVTQQITKLGYGPSVDPDYKPSFPGGPIDQGTRPPLVMHRKGQTELDAAKKKVERLTDPETGKPSLAYDGKVLSKNPDGSYKWGGYVTDFVYDPDTGQMLGLDVSEMKNEDVFHWVAGTMGVEWATKKWKQKRFEDKWIKGAVESYKEPKAFKGQLTPSNARASSWQSRLTPENIAHQQAFHDRRAIWEKAYRDHHPDGKKTEKYTDKDGKKQTRPKKMPSHILDMSAKELKEMLKKEQKGVFQSIARRFPSLKWRGIAKTAGWVGGALVISDILSAPTEIEARAGYDEAVAEVDRLNAMLKTLKIQPVLNWRQIGPRERNLRQGDQPFQWKVTLVMCLLPLVLQQPGKT